MRIADYLDRSASLTPDAELIVDGETRLTYAAAQDIVHRAAAKLAAEPSLRPGAHIGIYSPNSYRAALAELAVNRADMAWVMTPTGSSLPTSIECLDYLDCAWLFFHSRFETHIPEMKAQLPNIRGYVCLDAPSLHGPSFDAWIGGETGPFIAQPPDPSATSFLSLTGGTTGASKAVLHTHLSIEMMMITMFSTLGIGPGSRHLVVAPLSHAAGHLTHAFTLRGGTNILQDGFDAERVLKTIERELVTHLFLPPTAVFALLSHPLSATTSFASLRCFMVGAAPMPAEKLRQAIDMFGPVMYDVYGQTEAMFPLLLRCPEDYMLADGSLDETVLPVTGRPTPLVHLEIMDDVGNILPPGERGEIVLRSPSLMREYYKRPEQTAEVWQGGWHHTTDIGLRDERGFFTIVDRKKDMIISGGFNVYPAEIEAVIMAHPAVQECAVVGVPDDKWGEAVRAVIACRDGQTVSEEEIIAMCKASLGSVKTPKAVDYWPSLPHSPVGKILKRDIRAHFWRDAGRAI